MSDGQVSDNGSSRRVSPMSPASRESLRVFADKHVRTPGFQRRLAEVRRRMEDEQRQSEQAG